MGKPRGKASWESHRFLDPREGKRDTAATAREESARACPDSRRGLTPLVRHQKFHTPLRQLKKFPDIPVSTREEARESRPHPQEPRFCILAREEGSFPCVVGKEFPRSRRISRGGALHRNGERHSRVLPLSQSSPDVAVHSRETCLPCTASTFKPRIDSHHGGTWDSPVGKPRGKASLESFEGKPLIPWSTRREAGHCCYSSGGKRTCMPPLETRTDSPGETPEVPPDPCQHWRGILMFRNPLHTRS